MSENKFLPYAQQNINDADVEAVSKALKQPVITRGQLVEDFEKEMAAYCEATYAVAFNSGTAALMAAYAAVDTGQHDTVITTPNTFVSSVGSGIQQGATPVFVDIDRSTGNINLEHVALNINRPKSKGKMIVVPVHFGGIPADVEALDNSINDYNTVIIEDAAQAMGSRYKDGSKVGSCRWSQITIFSFHPAKIMTTGEGGLATTNDEKLYHKLKAYRNNGIEREPARLRNPSYPGFYEVNSLSGNYNFTEMQAALGLSQLKRIDTFIAKRKKLMDLYRKKLKAINHLRLLEPQKDTSVAWHMCVAQIDFNAYKKSKANVMESLKNAGIGTQVHYIPVYRHPFFSDKKDDLSEYFPEMETYYQQALTLPFYYDLEESDIDRVASNLKKQLEA